MEGALVIVAKSIISVESTMVKLQHISIKLSQTNSWWE